MATHPRFIARADLADFIGKTRPTIEDAVAFVEARLLLAVDDAVITDVQARPANNGKPGWMVTLTYERPL